MLRIAFLVHERRPKAVYAPSPHAGRQTLPPHLVGDLDDRAQLRPLLALGQNISFLGRGKAALRRQAKLIERNVFRGFVDPPLDLVATFERAGLTGDEPE